MDAEKTSWTGYRVETPDGEIGVVDRVLPGEPPLVLVRAAPGGAAMLVVPLEDVGWDAARGRVVALNLRPRGAPVVRKVA